MTYQAAIIIPHFNDTVRLARCLDALLPQIKGQSIELVVVDNASTDDLSEVKAAYPDVRFLDQPEKGAGPARNMGVAMTTAPRLFFTDSDCIPADQWVATAMAESDKDQIVGGPVKTFDETPPPRSGAQAFEAVFAFPFADYVKRQKFTGTGNLITTRTVFEATGPFKGGVFEDKDWCLRAGEQGYTVHYNPELLVSHPTRTDYDGLVRKWRSNTRVRFGLNGHRPVDRLRWAGRAVAVAGSALIHLGKIARHPDLSVRDKLAAATVLFRLRLLRAWWMMVQVLSPAEQRTEGRLYDT